jgi:hypothetical protein
LLRRIEGLTEFHPQGITSPLGDKIHPWGSAYAPRVKVKNDPRFILAAGFDLRTENLEETTAQLIADSIEKKFNFNPFKGMWKKKHYSFDFN